MDQNTNDINYVIWTGRAINAKEMNVPSDR